MPNLNVDGVNAPQSQDTYDNLTLGKRILADDLLASIDYLSEGRKRPRLKKTKTS